jgi:hypothetical protein
MTERLPQRGRHLRILWEDFDGSTIVPAGFPNAFFYLDTNTDAVPPVFYLNKSAKAALIRLAETLARLYQPPAFLPFSMAKSPPAVQVGPKTATR